MSESKKSHKEQVRIKNNVRDSRDYFEENYKRFDEFRKFVFVSSLTSDERSMSMELERPVVEFNVLEAYVSRLVGEFSKQEPAIQVSAQDGAAETPEMAEMISILEQHLRYILTEANKDGLEYQCYRDTLSGGFSVIKVYTEYKTPMSFHHEIRIKRAYDPCMCGFDPMAVMHDKSDGDYCYELYPIKKDDFKREYPNVDLTGVSFSRDIGGFSWSYTTQKDKVLLLCDYYEKKKKKVKICLLSNGKTMTMEQYEQYIAWWESSGQIAQAPIIVGEPRKTEITTICRYTMIENQIIDYTETDYPRFPLIFVDGNGILTKEEDQSVKHMTRPYVYNGVGGQKLKNFAGATLANELENMIQAQWMASKESIPPLYSDAWKNPQRAKVMIYNAFKNDNPEQPLQQPELLVRPQIPEAISQTFQMSDVIIQNALGSFDASLAKLTEHESSGIALQEMITLGNTAAMPYVVNFLRGLQSAGQLSVDLIPLYYTTPRTIPIRDAQGKQTYVKINMDGGFSFDYEKDAIQVKIEAGVSFGVQQARALKQIISLMNASEMFAQFANEVGLNIILDNVEIRGITELRLLADEWMLKKQQEAQAMAEQQAAMAQMEASKPNLEKMALDIAAQQVEAETIAAQEKIDLEQRKLRSDTLLGIGQLQLDQQKAKNDLVSILVKKEDSDNKNNIQKTRDQVQHLANATDFALKAVALEHQRKDKIADRGLKFHTAKFQSKRDKAKALEGKVNER